MGAYHRKKAEYVVVGSGPGGASVARESGKPCVVEIDRVTKILKDGQSVEMDRVTGAKKSC